MLAFAMHEVLMLCLLLAFAGLLTVHVLLAGKLAVAPSAKWRAPVALLVPPLALWWGWQLGSKRLVGTWLGSLAVYTVARLVAATL